METKLQHRSVQPTDLTFQLLKDITNNFAVENKVGSGGYAEVYRGVLPNGKEIAVKKLYQIQGLDDVEFKNEFNNLMMVQHNNIIQLVGYCYEIRHKHVQIEGRNILAEIKERALCFEYLPHGSLDKHLSDESCGLDWHTRYTVIKGICEGLNYLHNGLTNNHIYHLDLKPANILLDEHMMPKIADFGLSRLFRNTQTYITRNLIGTRGYMPPEYIQNLQISKKYDVFSLGVIIIQIMAGPLGYSNCAEMSSQQFIELVHKNWKNRLHSTSRDASQEAADSLEVKMCIEMALRCVEGNRDKRPTIGEIIDKLNGIENSKMSLTDQGSERKPLCTKEQIQGLWDSMADHWRDHHELVGRGSELRKLEAQIDRARDRQISTVISVCGIAGVGKSFLVGAFYDHFAHRFDSCAVVSASHPFDIMMFCQNLVHDLKPPEFIDADIFHQIWRHLDEKQCLVVIDDLRSKEDWDLIEGKLIFRASRSCSIVIIREESVARHCATSDDAVCRVKGLEADAARSLFEKETRRHGGTTSSWDSDMMNEAGLIINKCGRLPRLIVDLYKYLADKPNIIREVQWLNANFIYALKTREGLDTFRDVFTWIYSNFQACPQILKKCIIYLSIFTQSRIIRRSRLVRRWIAEGYSEGTDSKSTVEYTQKLIQELANLGMMEEQTHIQFSGIASCQINSFFLEYVISRGIEDNIFLPLEVSVLGRESSLKTQHAGQHLAVGSRWKREKFVFDNMDFSRLRSLTVSREWRPFFISDRMRVLRVLDVENTDVSDGDIEQIVRQVPHLKFLSLRRCKKVSCVPDSLGELKQLQTLDIRHTSVTKLPKSIIKLQKLQYIRAGTWVALLEDEPSMSWSDRHVDACDGIMVPKGIGALMALHTLGVVNVRARGGEAILKELKYLTQLNKLGVSGINRSNSKGLFSAIVGHSRLESLSLQLHNKDEDLEWLGKITPPGNLRRLKMYIHVVKYPHWSCLQILGQIKRLRTLGLYFEADQDVELQFCDNLDRNPWPTGGQFSEVKVLEIACSSNLHVKFTGREMFELEMLKVHCLNGSSLQFSGIDRYPPSLKHVWLKGSFDDTVKEELQRKVNQHPKKPNCVLA